MSRNSCIQGRPLIVRPPATQARGDSETESVPVSETYLSFAPPNCYGQPQNSLCPGPVDVDDNLLAMFRNELMSQYPFVVVPDHEHSDAFKRDRPFLMSAIRMVASFRSMESMRGQMSQLMTYLSDHMLLRAERSLDLLMGIVVILGWYHYHCLRHSQLNNLLSLAESLVADLDLMRGHVNQDQVVEDDHLLEGKRAALGVWYLRSSYVCARPITPLVLIVPRLTLGNRSAAIYYQQLNPMPFTAQLKQHLSLLEEAGDHDLDQLLAHLIKIQLLTQQIVDLNNARLDDGGDNGYYINVLGNEEGRRASTKAMLSASQDSLNRIIQDLPQSFRGNALITTHLNTAVLCVHQSLDAASSGSSYTKAWFEGWLSSIPASDYYTLPTPIIFQLIYAVRTLTKSGRESVLRTTEPGVSDPGSRPSSQARGHQLVRSSAAIAPGSAPSPQPEQYDAAWEVSEPAESGADWVAALGLTGLGMVEVLVAMGERCGEASGLLNTNASEVGAWDNNFWDVCGKNIGIPSGPFTQWTDRFEGVITTTCSSASGSPAPPSLCGSDDAAHDFDTDSRRMPHATNNSTPASEIAAVAAVPSQIDYDYEYKYSSPGPGPAVSVSVSVTPPLSEGTAIDLLQHQSPEVQPLGPAAADLGIQDHMNHIQQDHHYDHWATAPHVQWSTASISIWPASQPVPDAGSERIDTQIWFDAANDSNSNAQLQMDSMQRGWNSQMALTSTPADHHQFPLPYGGPA
ncbi:hypothetical protein B0T26DRAFT_756567 [Lasiosphaeria miniovina]|uniref:Transcription factor domain-containing protein n=1 Tax=Lasiosphaeria miniovina TaxID=1954250 RepID=A0AA39ZST2_9PEZI|nr:uncharacterized protein B0T26DRAFT_756567 [Lasiosphaeria miniovina]KAK0702971.1 hypothetical protein B0T26DRAFT_756567 [Lasiosphaeria miniovina]